MVAKWLPTSDVVCAGTLRGAAHGSVGLFSSEAVVPVQRTKIAPAPSHSSLTSVSTLAIFV